LRAALEKRVEERHPGGITEFGGGDVGGGYGLDDIQNLNVALDLVFIAEPFRVSELRGSSNTFLYACVRGGATGCGSCRGIRGSGSGSSCDARCMLGAPACRSMRSSIRRRAPMTPCRLG
jgi:hypothetical protein